MIFSSPLLILYYASRRGRLATLAQSILRRISGGCRGGTPKLRSCFIPLSSLDAIIRVTYLISLIYAALRRWHGVEAVRQRGTCHDELSQNNISSNTPAQNFGHFARVTSFLSFVEQPRVRASADDFSRGHRLTFA